MCRIKNIDWYNKRKCKINDHSLSFSCTRSNTIGSYYVFLISNYSKKTQMKAVSKVDDRINHNRPTLWLLLPLIILCCKRAAKLLWLLFTPCILFAWPSDKPDNIILDCLISFLARFVDLDALCKVLLRVDDECDECDECDEWRELRVATALDGRCRLLWLL